MAENKIDGYRVVVVGNGVIRNLGLSAPYKGALKEDKIRNIMGEGKSINFLQKEDASGCLLTPADIAKRGSIENALNFYGFRRNGNTYYVEKYAELGTEGFHKKDEEIIAGEVADGEENGEHTSEEGQASESKENGEDNGEHTSEEGQASESETPSGAVVEDKTVKNQQHNNGKNGKNKNFKQQ